MRQHTKFLTHCQDEISPSSHSALSFSKLRGPLKPRFHPREEFNWPFSLVMLLVINLFVVPLRQFCEFSWVVSDLRSGPKHHYEHALMWHHSFESVEGTNEPFRD
jgi:hypothetical protein